MKILVCVSKTPDTTSKISFSSDGSEFNSNGITYIMNPNDEWFALVRALEIVEKGGGTVTIVNVGDASNDQIIRKGLAIGANDAVRINAEPRSSMFIAKQIAEYARSENYDIIFTGKESIDYNSSEVGSMIAEFLDRLLFPMQAT
jgi:electron transfer flavoprotein beta subunit